MNERSQTSRLSMFSQQIERMEYFVKEIPLTLTGVNEKSWISGRHGKLNNIISINSTAYIEVIR